MTRNPYTEPFDPQDYLSGKKRWMRPALVPFVVKRLPTVVAGTIGTAVEAEAPIALEDDASEEQQRALYEGLISISWLAPKVRAAVLKELGSSVSQYKASRARVLRMAIADLKERGLPPGSAVAHVAKIEGTSEKALKQRVRAGRMNKKKR
ncbi:MAG: hypothetical protein ACLP19_28470 [Xanthobacteraceae bacterium]